MGFSAILSELMRRYEITAQELATKTGWSRPHISNVAAGNEKGSLKLIGDCMRAVGIDAEDCVLLPLDPKVAKEDDRTLYIIRQAMRRGGEDRERVYECAETLKRRMARKEAG